MRSGYKYTIPNNERIHHHLVVSQKTHEAVVFYAQKWGLTITEATQRLLASVIEEAIDERTKQ